MQIFSLLAVVLLAGCAEQGRTLHHAKADSRPDSQLVKFENQYMPEVRRLALLKGVKVPSYEDYNGEALEEWLWLQFYLMHKSTREAADAVIATEKGP